MEDRLQYIQLGSYRSSISESEYVQDQELREELSHYHYNDGLKRFQIKL